MNRKKDNNGFTLIELLAVIVILALVMGIAIFSVEHVINNSKVNIKKISVNNLIDATNMAVLTNSLTLPATFEVYTGGVESLKGTISLKGNSNIKVEYDKEKPTGGMIYVDQTGSITAYGLTFDDGYVCTMASGENGCGKMEARSKILNDYSKALSNGSAEYLKDDPLIPERKVFYGGKDIANKIKISQDDGLVDYRIVSIESDGTLKLVKDGFLYLGDNTRGYDTAETRNNSNNTYCEGSTTGCNAWTKVKGLYVNGSYRGTVNVNSSMKTFLEESFSQILGSSVKKNMVSTIYSIAGLSKNANVNKMYEEMHSFDVQTKIGLLDVRDWFLASGSTGCTIDATTLRYGDTGSDICAIEGGVVKNYLYMSTNWWYLMQPYNSWSRTQVFAVTKNGQISRYNASTRGYTKPVFYLSNSVKLTGNGNDIPYQIED